MQGDPRGHDDEQRPPAGWGRDWAPASWSGADPSQDTPAAAAGATPAGGPSAPGAGDPVPGVSDTLERGFSVLRRSPGTVFAAGAALGVTLLVLELAGWWVLRACARRLLPDGRSLHTDPGQALAAIDRAGLVTAAVTVTAVLAVAWVLVVTTRTVVDGVVAVAAASPARRVPAGPAFGAARRRLGPLLRAGLVVGLVSAALVALPVAGALLVLVNPLVGVLAVLAAGLVAVPGLAWLWVRSSLLGADLVSGGGGVRAAWRRDGQLLRQGLGSAVVLLVVGAAIAVAAGGAASVPLQYLTAVLWQETQASPLLWLDRTWWDGLHLDVFLVAGAHAVATAVGYPLLSVISALIWTERCGSAAGSGPADAGAAGSGAAEGGATGG